MKKILIIALVLVSASVTYALSRYELNGDRFIVNLSLNYLKSQVGVREVGNNSGKEVRFYQSTVGIGRAAWCAALQYAAYYVAQKELLKYGYHAAIPIPRTGHANTFANFAEAKGIKTDALPQINDFLIWWNNPGNPGSSGHIARIYEVGMGGWVYTIEGNTSSGLGSQREGDGVYTKKRNIYKRIGSLRVRALVGVNSRLIDKDWALFKLFGVC